MSEVLKMIECRGFTKDEAFKDLNFDPNNPVIPGVNATQAWNKAGSPIPGTVDFKRFITLQLEEKTKYKPGYGIHIVLSPPVRDIRRRPYSIINNKTAGTREWTFKYYIREDMLDVTWLDDYEQNEDGEIVQADTESMEITVTQPGPVVEICDSKAEALRKMKDLITATHKCYSILPVKVPNITPVAAFGLYTPSNGAKEGIFLACGINKEI